MTKLKLILSLALGALLVSCAPNDEMQISGTVKNMQGTPIIYYQSVNGMFNSQSCDTLKVNADSTYTLTLPAEQYKRLRFILWGKDELGTIITSGKKITVNMDGTAGQHLDIKGINRDEMEISTLLNDLNVDVWDFRGRRSDRWNIAKDTVASSVVAKLKADAMAMEEKIKDADKNLFSKARQEIRMQMMLVFLKKLYSIDWECSEATKQLWQTEGEKMKEICSENHPDSPFSLPFFDVVGHNVGYTYFVKGVSVPDSVNMEPNELSFHYFKHNLTGKAQEAAMAQLFLQDEARQENAPAIIPLAKRFKELYPQSPWIPLVDRAVNKNKAFQEAKIPEYIHFPNVEKAKTLKDVTDLYKGKVIFMDIWATWCGPCRSSFAHIKPLQEYTRQHDDVVLLYLSLDKTEDDEKWRKMAAHYDLAGEHVRIQEAFKNEIYETFGGKRVSLVIPRYVIFDKNGEIRFSSAASPEDMDKLTAQLEEARK